MKLTIEHDDGKVEYFNEVTDLYVAIRQGRLVNKDANFMYTWSTYSASWGGEVRELLKEIRQSIGELEDVLRGITNGRSS